MAKDILVIYKKDCLDSFTASWVLWLKYGVTAKYFGASYDKPLLVSVKNKHVFMVGFSYPVLKMLELAINAKSLTIFDNNKTSYVFSEDILAERYNGVIDIKHSNAVLVWNFLYRKHQQLPVLLEFMQDFELKKFDHEFSNDISLAMGAKQKSFKLWSTLILSGSLLVTKTLMREGKQIQAVHKNFVKRAINNAYEASFKNRRVAITCCDSHIIDEVGEALCKNRHLAMMYQIKNKKVLISLRSDRNDPLSVDVSSIAKEFFGGGNHHSAGFTTNLSFIEGFCN